MWHSLLPFVGSMSLGVVGQLSLKVVINPVPVIDAASLAGTGIRLISKADRRRWSFTSEHRMLSRDV